MHVTVDIEQQDYIRAITPFRNGCSFRAIFEKDGRVMLEPGCYLLVNLVQGVERWFLDQWKKNNKKPFEISPSPETRHEMLKIKPCHWCGGSLMAGEFMNIYVSSWGQVPVSDETLAETNKFDRRRSDVRRFEKDLHIIFATECELSRNAEIPPDFII